MLTPIQKAAIRHILAWEQSPPETRLDHREWCEQVGISRKTLENWRKVPEFESALESQRTAMEESSDPYALIARTTSLEQLMAMMNKMGTTVTEKRMLIKDVMEVTKHVDASGDPVSYEDMTGDDLVAAILNRDLSPLGMTELELKRLAKGEPCLTSSDSSSEPVSPSQDSSEASPPTTDTSPRKRGRPRKTPSP